MIKVLKEKIFSLIIVIICLSILVCIFFRPREYNFKFNSMGISFDLLILSIPYLVNLTSLEEDIKTLIDQQDSQLSRWRSGSQIAKINMSAGIKEVEVTPEIFKLVKKAKEISFLTQGDFKFLFSNDLNKKSSIDSIVLNKDKSTVYLMNSDLFCDFKHLESGYIVDKIVLLLKDYGIHNAVISSNGTTKSVLGSNILSNWEFEIKMNQDAMAYLHTKKDISFYIGEKDLFLIAKDATTIAAISTTLKGLSKRLWKRRFNSFKNTEFLFYNNVGSIVKSNGFDFFMELEK